MKPINLVLGAGLCLAILSAPALAQTCGGSFQGFVNDMKSEARTRGHSASTVDRFFSSVRQDPAVIRADRRQGIFQMPFTDFARRLISQNRIVAGERVRDVGSHAQA